MKLIYQQHLKLYSQELRKRRNLSEVILWNELKSDKLGYRFLRQQPINKYIVDFYCPLLHLAIEIDGVASRDNRIDQDEARQKALELSGIKVVRFQDTDVRYNLGGVIEYLKAEIFRLAKIPRLSGTPFPKGGISPPPLGKEE